jgi:hypothetical protein
VVAGWRLIAERHHLTLYDRDGNQPLKGVVVPPLAGWLQAYEAGRHRAALIAGTGIGLDTGEPGLLAAVRGGRVVGATVATHPIDEREHVHVFIVKWRTEGKVARFVIDGRRYHHRMPCWPTSRRRRRSCRAVTCQPRSRLARSAPPSTGPCCRPGRSSARG